MAVQCGIDSILVDEQQLKRQPIKQWQEALIGTPIPYHSQKALKSNCTINESTINYLNVEYKNIPTESLLEIILNNEEMGKIAVVSSFGSESAVLLHMLAKFSPDTDVLFLDTGKLFHETLEYQQRLTAALKLTNVKIIRPSETSLNKNDQHGYLNIQDSNSCCELRKVIPLQTALAGYDTWISGRKLYQSEGRSSLQMFERSGSQIKINPLANWRQDELADYIEQHNLPKHPLVAKGYTSIGCAPCTTPVIAGENPRGGRWRGQGKSECGIHFNNNKVINKKAQTNPIIIKQM
ncbi:MAG: phosphoadenylyl-sulfate reductase [Gammaproteobacteria bacterium]|nr:phosphoadenylyl-sulfate reductase [Gammaproteobacteria bacterium]